MKIREIIKLIEKDGWHLVNQVGSHRQYKHSNKTGRVTIAGHPADDIAPGTLKYKMETTSYGDEAITIICGKDVKSVDELMQKIEDIASKGKIDRIAYFGHSGRSALYAFEAPGENIYAREGWQKSWFNEGAKMGLYGCNAGVGFRSIAQKLADKTGISVWAYTSDSFFTADYKLGHLQRTPTNQDVTARRVDGDRIWLTPKNGRPMTEFTPHPWHWYWNPKNW